MQENQVVIAEKNGKTFLKSAHNKLLVGAAAALPLVAMAEPLDMSAATTQLALGLGAVGARAQRPGAND